MRTELRIALWIVALLALGLTALHRPSVGVLDSEDGQPSPIASAVVELSPAIIEDGATLSARATSTRPLLRIPEPELESETATVAFDEPFAPSPTLKGIIDTGAGPRAVFEGVEGEPVYVVVGVEETVGPLRVTSISSDMVSAEGNDGNVIYFKLRGSGESLE